MRYAVSDVGVQTLRAVARRAETAAQEVAAAVTDMQNSAREKSRVLGPHYGSLMETLEQLQNEQATVTQMVEDVASALDRTADSYEDIIANDPFGDNTGGAAAGEAHGQPAAPRSSGGGLIGKIFGGFKGGASAGQQFGGFETGTLKNGTIVIKGDHYDQYLDDYYHYDQSTYESTPQLVETVSPSQIEGVHLGDTEAQDPNRFWGMHNSSKDFFIEAASHIPEVKAALDSGRSLEELKADPVLGTCAGIYFDPENMPRVEKCGGYYAFDSDGRHRIIAARELGYDIPVCVIGVRRRKA